MLLLLTTIGSAVAEGPPSVEVIAVEHDPRGVLTASLIAPDGEAPGEQDLVALVDGVPRPLELTPVEATPLSIVIAIETSSSMPGPPLQAAQRLALDLIAGLAAEDRVAVVSFGDSAAVVHALSADGPAAQSAVLGLTPTGLSALHDGVALSAELLGGVEAEGRALVLLTHGWHFGGATGRAESVAALSASGAPAYVVAVGPEYDVAYLEGLAAASGGASWPAGGGVDAGAALTAALERLRAEAGPLLARVRVPPLTLGEHVLTFRASADDGGVATSHAFDVTNDGLIAAVVAEPEAEGGTLFVDIDSLAPAGSLVFDAHAGGRPLEVDARSGRVAIDPWAFSAGPLALEIAALVDGALASALTTTVQIPRLAPALEVALDDPQRPTALLATGRVQGAASTLVVSLDGAELARTVAGEVRVPIDRGGEATVQLADAAGEVVATRSVAVPAASTGGRSWPVPAALGTVAVAAAYGVLVLWRRRPPASVSAAPAPVRAALEARLAGPSHARATRPAGARRQRIALVVYPFDSFAAVARFQTALRRLSGIVDARLTSFEARTLHLTVDYEDVVPLAERLERSTGFSSRVVTRSPEEIEVRLT